MTLWWTEVDSQAIPLMANTEPMILKPLPMISQNTMCSLCTHSPQTCSTETNLILCFLELQCGVGVLLHPFPVFSTGQFFPRQLIKRKQHWLSMLNMWYRTWKLCFGHSSPPPNLHQIELSQQTEHVSKTHKNWLWTMENLAVLEILVSPLEY